MSKSDPVIITNDPIKTWKSCGGYYECPKDAGGKRLGPLVGYAGRYRTSGGEEKQYVGEGYFNFARVEQYPHILDFFAKRLAGSLAMHLGNNIDVVCGAPLGGMFLASAVGRFLDCRTIFAEKKLKSPATEWKREESALVLGRHEIWGGDRVIIMEDVCNNFSTTGKLGALIEEARGSVVAVGCALNRSSRLSFIWRDVLILPIFSVILLPMPQYRQEDPEVTDDVAKGNVIWKPKDEWMKLQEIMTKYSG